MLDPNPRLWLCWFYFILTVTFRQCLAVLVSARFCSGIPSLVHSHFPSIVLYPELNRLHIDLASPFRDDTTQPTIASMYITQGNNAITNARLIAVEKACR